MDNFNEDIKKMCGIEVILDDSFFEKEDKITLFKHLKQLYEKKFEWAAEALVKCFILSHYKEFIEIMHQDNNIEKYLEEKKNSEGIETTFENFFK
tara:strand:- start:765 stop:1049 length:285 start_codon:yes stop_codon:yes gene_type:complete